MSQSRQKATKQVRELLLKPEKGLNSNDQFKHSGG